jgi:hypothetical protein
MIYINDEKISLATQPKSSIGQMIYKKMAELRPALEKRKFRLVWRKGVEHINKLQGIKESKKGVFVPFTVHVNNEEGTNKVVFCDSATRDAVGNMHYREKGEWFKGSRTLGIEDMELALYYSLFCPYVKSGLIVIENKEAEALETATARQSMAKYLYYLYEETSPIFADKDKLIEIAKAFGIGGADDMDINLMKNAIHDAVVARETHFKDGIKYFEKYIKGEDEMLKPLADVQTLIDMNEIYIDHQDFSWKLKGGNKFMALSPTDVQNVQEAKKRLANYLVANPDKYEALSTILDTRITVPEVTTIEELEMLDFEQLKALGKQHGLKTYQISKEKLILNIRQKLGV